MRPPAALAMLLLLAACGSNDRNVPGDSSDHEPFSEIPTKEVLKLTGTEPFWGGEVTGMSLTYTTPDNQDGTTIAVSRFAGRGGLSFSGTLDGKDLVLAVTPGDCSDGMSDRTYPFVATLRLGGETRMGCAYSAGHPYTEPEAP